jgi:lycopene cyclase domain-containing protein
MRHLTYLAVLAFCLLCTAPLAVWLRRSVFADVRRLALTFGVTFVVFVTWDLYAIHAGHWSYDRGRTTGVVLPGSLPLEEALFFVVVPLCIVLTFEAVDALVSRGRRR